MSSEIEHNINAYIEQHSNDVSSITMADVMALIRYVQQEVEEKFHVRIEPEVRLLGEF